MRKNTVLHCFIIKLLKKTKLISNEAIQQCNNLSSGFSVIEVILAAALFMIIATGSITVILQGTDSNRLGEEQAVANQYAAEGMEAVRSIKNQNFANLVNSAGTGIAQVGNVWTFSGGSNILSSKYTRVIKVENVYRDISGNIVSSGGTLDTKTKKITSTVVWNFGPTRANSVVFTSYLTNFRKPIVTDGGVLIYGDRTTTPKFRTYETSLDRFSKEVSAPTSASGNTFVVKTSPTKTEATAGYVTSAGILHILCYDGQAWSEDWTVTVGGTGTTRRFDIAYETNSGNVMVLYSTNVGTTNELAYRTKLGSIGCGTVNWAAARNFNPVRTAGVVQWVKMAWDRRPGSNLITAIWADANSALSAAVWSGSAWGNEPSTTTETSLAVANAAQDVDDFDVEYESLSGDVMVVWANSAGSDGINGVRYRTCTGGTSTCTWTAVTTPPTFLDDATNLDISANPNTDEIVFASIGKAGSNLQIGYWSGSLWTDTARIQTDATPVAGSHLVSTGWLISGATTRSIVVYSDPAATNFFGYYSGVAGVFTAQTAFTPTPLFSDIQLWYDIAMNPNSKDGFMFTISDNNNNLFAKRLVMTSTPTFAWTNSDGGAALEATLPQAISSPFSFVYWRSLAD